MKSGYFSDCYNVNSPAILLILFWKRCNCLPSKWCFYNFVRKRHIFPNESMTFILARCYDFRNVNVWMCFMTHLLHWIGLSTVCTAMNAVSHTFVHWIHFVYVNGRQFQIDDIQWANTENWRVNKDGNGQRNWRNATKLVIIYLKKQSIPAQL